MRRYDSVDNVSPSGSIAVDGIRAIREEVTSTQTPHGPQLTLRCGNLLCPKRLLTDENQGSYVNLVFNGTAVYLYGQSNVRFARYFLRASAQHKRQGAFSVTVDGDIFSTNDAHLPPRDTSSNTSLIFARDGLQPGKHNVTVQNLITDSELPLVFDRGILSFGDGSFT